MNDDRWQERIIHSVFVLAVEVSVSVCHPRQDETGDEFKLIRVLLNMVL